MKAELINSMGDDLTIVNSARVSFDKETWWSNEDEWLEFDTPLELEEKDKKLISYLAKHEHFTPFTHCMITMRETVPIFVARQRFKHTVGFSYNEKSRRYVDSTPEFYTPDTWRKKADNVKQGSSEEAVDEPLRVRMTTSETTSDVYKRYLEISMDLYKELIDNGTCAEQARMLLPQSMMTSYYVTGSLAAWARAYKLRIDSHSQKEIQMLAKQWDEIIRPLFPVSWEALVK
ncbi:MAG: FAD-dependent thymidylate synthase [Wohlfahrtiimonas sp.]